MKKSITVLLPAFNEADRIKETIHSIQASTYVTRILAIDDGSVDNTFDVAKDAGAEVLRLDKNLGKGSAMNYGIQRVVDTSDIIIFLDADIGGTAKDVDKLIIPLLQEDIDVTIAKFPSPKKKGGFGLVKNLARVGVRFYTGQTINTSLSGQRAFKTRVLKELGPLPTDYGVEVGMTIEILNKGFKIQEVEVNMTHRETGRDVAGFIHRGKQFYQIFKTLLRQHKEVYKQ